MNRSKTLFASGWKPSLAVLIAGIFLALALAALASHLYSVKTNPGDSGESAIVLLPFSIPWILMIPRSVAYSQFWGRFAYVFYLLFAALNAFILYIFIALLPRFPLRNRPNMR